MNLDRIYDGLRKLKFAFLLLIATLFSGFATYDEARFKLKGVPVEAVVVKTYEPDPDRDEVAVDFRAEHEGQTAPGWAKVGLEEVSEFQPGSRHPALWLSGKRPRVRIVGYSPSGWLVWVFLLCLGALGWSLVSALRSRAERRGDPTAEQD